jgi:hypothetical protein
MTMPIRPASAAAVLLALAAPAQAEIATLTYESVLNDGTTPRPDGWPDDILLSGVLVYDTEAAPHSITPTTDSYQAISHEITLSKDGVSVTFLANGVTISVTNDQYDPVLNRYTDTFVTSFSATDGSFYGFDISNFRAIFEKSTNPNNILVGTALPTSEEPFNELNLRLAVLQGGTPSSTEFGAYGIITSISFSLDSDYVLACDGFYEPFDSAISLSRKSRQVLPLRMSLFDQDGGEVGADMITAPVVSVSHTALIGGGELDELSEAASRATEGNSFVWDDVAGEWHYNLGTKPFASKGTYTVSVTAGDDDYAMNRTCIGTFVRQ